MKSNDYPSYPVSKSRMELVNNEKIIDDSLYRIIEIKHLTKETFTIKLPKPRFAFKAGQHISVAIHGNFQSREYSIYSGAKDEYLEILVKEVQQGFFTPRLRKLKPGHLLEVSGPYGKFGLDPGTAEN